MIEELILKYGSQLAIGTILVVLLAYFGRIIITYLLAKVDEKDNYIKDLMKSNQVNLEKFERTVNHSQHDMMEVLKELGESISSQSKSIDAQTAVFKQLVKENYNK
mgnify:FL=1